MDFKFIRTEQLDPTDRIKSLAIIEINGEEVLVPFWYSITQIYSKEDAKDLICAEGLISRGYFAEARILIQNRASGEAIKDDLGNIIEDSRNWRQNWLDNNPNIQNIFIDPLL